MTLIYLAGPIDAHLDNPVDRTDVKVLLGARGWAVFDPSTAYAFGNEIGPEEARAVYESNEAILSQANGVVALWPEGASSIGTPMEIASAYRANKPLVVLGAQHSMQLRGMGVKTFDWHRPSAAVEYLAAAMRPENRELQELAREAVEGEAWKARNGYGAAAGAYDRWETGQNLIKWTGAAENAPTTGYEGDAGFDLRVAEDTVINVDSFVDVPCGINIELPSGVWAMVTGRSSTIRKKQLLVNQGIIDQGYRGPIFAAVWNLGTQKAKLEAGERIAQLIPFDLTAAGLKWQHVDELGVSERGVRAFGSTGA